MIEPETVVARASDHRVDEMAWGRLEWMVGGAFGNSRTMTVGRCVIAPGRENARHYHPNCDEVLYVVQGRIEHSLGEETVTMGAGDAISIPEGTWHHARNIGAQEAIFVIAFSSADRRTVTA